MPADFETCVQLHSYQPVPGADKSKRKLEFARGRKVASMLLIQLGAVGNVGVAMDRAPIWPTGFIGSISHSYCFVWVAVGHDSAAASVGIDTEAVVDVSTQNLLRPEIATEQEWMIADAIGLDPATTFTLVFSAKEAFYKCCYPLTRLYFDFKDISVDATDDDRIRLRMGPTNPNLSTEDPTIRNQLPPSLDVFFFVHRENVFTVTWINQPEISRQELQ